MATTSNAAAAMPIRAIMACRRPFALRGAGIPIPSTEAIKDYASILRRLWAGETVSYDNLTFTAEKVQGRRIAKVLISRKEDGESEPNP